MKTYGFESKINGFSKLSASFWVYSCAPCNYHTKSFISSLQCHPGRTQQKKRCVVFKDNQALVSLREILGLCLFPFCSFSCAGVVYYIRYTWHLKQPIRCCVIVPRVSVGLLQYDHCTQSYRGRAVDSVDVTSCSCALWSCRIDCRCSCTLAVPNLP